MIEQRKRKGLTQAEIASKTFIDRSYYGQIENGVRTPSVEVAKAIATVLEFNPSTFFFNDSSVPFLTVLEDAPFIVAHCDLQLRYTWIFNAHFDFDPNDLIGKRDDEIAIHEGTSELMNLKQTIIDTGKPLRKTIQFRLSNGDRYYDIHGKPLLNANGRIVGVLTASTDITEVLQIYSHINPESEHKRIQALQRYHILDTPPDGAFDRIVSLSAQLFQVPISIISLVDTDRIWFKSYQGVDIQEIDRVPGLCASAILCDVPYVINDASIDPRSLANPLVAGELGLRFYAGVQLTTHDNYNLGVLSIIDLHPRTITEDELNILKTLSHIVIDEMELRLAARRINELNKELQKKA